MLRYPNAARFPAKAWLALLACAAACRSPEQHRAAADRAVYSILEERRAALGLGAAEFTIEPPADSLRQRLSAGEALGPLPLIQVLSIAAENSRDYQRRKEDLFLSALDLTLERFRFEVQTKGNAGALLSGNGDGATRSSNDAGFGLSKVLGTGAAIVGDLGLNLARDLTRADAWDLTSDLTLTITQPLLRGFGQRIVKEPLTQAERDVVYQVRAFERFRRTFAVDVTSRYYRILQQFDTVANERVNMENLQLLRARNQEWARAGRLSDIQVDQALQDELRSKNRLITEEARLATQLDDFKLFLGLPITAPLELLLSELEQLQDVGLDLAETQAIDVALAQRLDYLTSLDSVDDAERRLEIAADNLRSSLDVESRTTATSDAGRPLDYANQDLIWTLSLELDLPLDIVQERNAYRASIVTLERARRTADEHSDTIRGDLRSALRDASTQRESLQIQEGSVKLAERRVESTNLNRDAGRADTRDILDAQEALRSARNALTAARIDQRISHLTLWRDMELIRVDENGIHDETLEPPTEQQP